MSRGGKREGAGRKPGSINRFSKQTLDRVTRAGILPVDYLLSVMRDDAFSTAERLDAAKAAAPYLHHKLTTQSLSVAAVGISHDEWLASLQ